jgi:hypothetical protein
VPLAQRSPSWRRCVSFLIESGRTEAASLLTFVVAGKGYLAKDLAALNEVHTRGGIQKEALLRRLLLNGYKYQGQSAHRAIRQTMQKLVRERQADLLKSDEIYR